MQFGLTETQQVLKNSAREFLAGEAPIAEVRRLMETDTAYDERLWGKLVEQGWLGIIIPEEYGGMGLGLVELAAAMEEMGRALLPGPYLATLLATAAIEASGNGAARSKYLPAIAGGRKATLALLEKDASWDPDAVRLPLNTDGLQGTKLFVSDAAVADFIVCAARRGSELVLAVVTAGAPGLSLQPMPAIDGTRRLYAAAFDNVDAEVIASGAAARAAVERALDVATVALAAEMVGGMQRVLEITVEYAKTRKQFGKPIGQYQAVQHMCADMLVWTESSRSAAYYAAWALNEALPEAAAAVSVAKAYASDAYREVGNRGIQVHGGMGFTWENDVHLYYRRAKASEICFGDAIYHRERIARLVIDGAKSRTAEA
jgi:alkylation response protein AidB-like acyl-CoA dehydrogenase